tara:strand:+ start:589 stop:813 length:225 start_codon:yes stop_codon:yes gene_type:complete
MIELMDSFSFWLGITLINTFFLFRSFIKNVILSKRLESAIIRLSEKKKEVVKVESILNTKILSLVKELEELKNS